MQLVHFNLEFQFDEATQLHTPARKVFHALGSKATKIRPAEPGAAIKYEKSKLEINWQYERYRIRLEETEDRSKLLSMINKLLETTDNVAPMGKLRNVQILTEWILPATRNDFDSLNELYVRTMICSKEFMPGICDSSVVLDSIIDDFVLHHQSGPMMQKQLAEQYLIFKHPNLPKNLIFLLVSARYQKMIQYDKKEMNRLIENAFSLCESHSNEFGKIWEGRL